ncbi:MAG TPA: lipopolysaccharide heptosyltransferase II [Vicinamibacterales bacterium]
MRVALRAPNWLGDAVMALPALAAFRRALAGDDVTLVGPRSVMTLFDELHDAQPARTLTLAGGTGRAAVASLRAGGFDRIVLFTNSFGSAWLAKRAGIRERWGYGGRGRGLLLTRAARRPSKGERGHHADFYRTLARRFDAVEGLDAPPRLTARPETRARGADALRKAGVDAGRPLVVFAPGAAYGHAKRWTPARVAEVAARLVRERGAAAVLEGAPADRDTGRAIESWLRAHAPAEAGRVVNMIGRADVRGLVGTLAHASLVIANDSGAAHLAAAMGVPTITIFGPTDERVSAPIGPGAALSHDVFCRPCMLRDCPIDHRCMKRITADTVFARAEALLQA